MPFPASRWKMSIFSNIIVTLEKSRLENDVTKEEARFGAYINHIHYILVKFSFKRNKFKLNLNEIKSPLIIWRAYHSLYGINLDINIYFRDICLTIQ